MNQVNLEAAIKSLRDLADQCETSRDNIAGYYTGEGDTLEKEGYQEPEDFKAAVNTAVETVRNRADTIETYKDKIVELNQSGVASKDADGVITLTLPDDATIPDNDPENFASWAQATIDADDLKNALSEVPERRDRTYDDIIASIQAHSNNPAYADAMITEIGPDNLTSLPLCAGRGKYTSDPEKASADLASLFGNLVASASTGRGSWAGWSEDKCQQVANAITESVDDSKECERLPILNCIFGGHDADGNHVNDLKFNHYLLVDLAEGLDDMDLNKVHEDRKGVIGALSFADDSYSFDPLAGVLDAMGSNRFAALTYFAPATEDGGVDTSRIDELSTRGWDQVGLAGYTAALAAGSSLRDSTVGDQANRATELAGHAINGLAENTEESIYNDDAKARIATLLGNCRSELTSALKGDDGYDDLVTKNKISDAVGGGDFINLSYRVADNQDAVATLSASIGEWAHQASQIDIAGNPDNPDEQFKGIQNRYQQSAEALSFLAGMADDKAGRKTDQAGDTVKASSDNTKLAFNVFSTVASAGLGAVGGPLGSTAGKTAMSVGSTLLAPVIAKSPKVQDVSSAMSTPDLTMTTKAAAIAEAANAGLLDPADYNVPEDDPDAFAQYGWLKPEGASSSRASINLDFGSNIIDDERDKSDPTDDQVETPSQQVVHWAEGAYERTGDDRLRALTNAVVLGKADRYADGATVKQNGGG